MSKGITMFFIGDFDKIFKGVLPQRCLVCNKLITHKERIGGYFRGKFVCRDFPCMMAALLHSKKKELI